MLEHGIADEVAVGVVDGLEMIEVEHGHVQRMVAPCLEVVAHGLFDDPEEAAAVRQPGELVPMGEPVQLGFESAALADVDDHPGDAAPAAGTRSVDGRDATLEPLCAGRAILRIAPHLCGIERVLVESDAPGLDDLPDLAKEALGPLGRQDIVQGLADQEGHAVVAGALFATEDRDVAPVLVEDHDRVRQAADDRFEERPVHATAPAEEGCAERYHGPKAGSRRPIAIAARAASTARTSGARSRAAPRASKRHQ